MKSFKEYIAEEDTDELGRLQMVDLLNQVRDDCQQFLHRAASNGKFHPLYVGLPTARYPNTEVQVRKDRAPVPTPKRIQDAFDRVMSELYSKEFRSDSFYATGNPDVALKRGPVKHLVFPIGKFEYLWSPKVTDLIHGFGSEEDITDGSGMYFDMHDAEDEDAEDKIVKTFLKDNEFVLSKELKTCADKGHDVMIDCKYYYAIPASEILKHYSTFQKMIGDLHKRKSLKVDLA
jgi:hypothetical protein